MGYQNRETVNGDQQRELTYEAFYNEGILYKDYDEVQAKQYAQQNVDVWAPKLDRYSDWESALFKSNGSMENYEFAAQGGNENTNFYASLAYKNEKGMVESSWMKGFFGRANVSHKSNDGK